MFAKMVTFSTFPPAPECGTNDKLIALACGDRYLRGVDVRSRKRVRPCALH